MEYAHIIDHLDSAIQAWKSEQTSQDAAPSSRASPQASRQDLLAAARGLVFALEAKAPNGPNSPSKGLNKSKWSYLDGP